MEAALSATGPHRGWEPLCFAERLAGLQQTLLGLRPFLSHQRRWGQQSAWQYFLDSEEAFSGNFAEP